jgi:hypothetical protein
MKRVRGKEKKKEKEVEGLLFFPLPADIVAEMAAVHALSTDPDDRRLALALVFGLQNRTVFYTARARILMRIDELYGKVRDAYAAWDGRARFPSVTPDDKEASNVLFDRGLVDKRWIFLWSAQRFETLRFGDDVRLFYGLGCHGQVVLTLACLITLYIPEFFINELCEQVPTDVLVFLSRVLSPGRSYHGISSIKNFIVKIAKRVMLEKSLPGLLVENLYLKHRLVLFCPGAGSKTLLINDSVPRVKKKK